MKRIRSLRAVCVVAAWIVAAASIGAAAPATAAAKSSVPAGDYTEQHDTIYNSLTVERRGSVVELRARSKRGVFLESAVDLADPLKLVVPYTRSLYAGLFFEPAPKRVLMIGLGGAGFHRLFATAFPQTILQSVELDPKVTELAESRMEFRPTETTPVAALDGRLYVKRSKEHWDWIILDAFRGGFVPPHLKTEEFYRECAAKLSERGVFVVNLHSGTKLYHADLKTMNAVFPQIVLFATPGTGNVIACGVKYRAPVMNNPTQWTIDPALNARLLGRVDLKSLRSEYTTWPEREVKKSKLLSDDFAPVEFLDAVEENNTKGGT